MGNSTCTSLIDHRNTIRTPIWSEKHKVESGKYYSSNMGKKSTMLSCKYRPRVLQKQTKKL